MGGGGTMSHMNSSLKFNRSQLKKRSYYKDYKSLYADGAKEEKVELQKATPKQLEVIRESVIAARKKEKTRLFVALTGALLVTSVVFYFIVLSFWSVSDRGDDIINIIETHERANPRE